MCGIIGIAGCGNGAMIKSAASLMEHRGPDADGYYCDGYISLGHKRLSIIDTDNRSTQPLWDIEGRTCIVFNGEIYNYKELSLELKKSYTFRTTSDTEVILYGHKRWGSNVVSRLRGMYAYAIYDKKEHSITLVRDHAGMKPLFYYHHGGVFAFASEVRALMSLLRSHGITPPVNKDAILLYWAFGYVPAPHTVWGGVSVLPASSVVSYNCVSGELHLSAYKPEVEGVRTEDELYKQIESSIEEHLVADVPVGLFFSGGTDSSLIAAVLKKKGYSIEGFSVAVEGRGADEQYFKAIRDYLGLKVEVVSFGRKESELAYRMAMRSLDVPLADTSLLPMHTVSHTASHSVKVVLSGEGGDELFFGYPRHSTLLHMNVGLARASLDRVGGLMPNISGKGSLLLRAYKTVGDPFGYYITLQSPLKKFLSKEVLVAGRAYLHENVSDPLMIDMGVYLENDLLRKTDMATMTHSIEGRMPFLDPRIIKSAANFRGAFTGDQLKPVLKRMLAREIPREFVYRRKSGFGLSPRIHLAHMEAFENDVREALEWFSSQNIPHPKFPEHNRLVEKETDTAFALVALYWSIRNVLSY